MSALTPIEEQICRLALDAIEDGNARVVLGDLIVESGWCADVVPQLMMYVSWEKVDPPFEPTWFAGELVSPTGPYCAAGIAAVLLFGDWPTSWPLAERCRRLHVNPWRIQKDDLLRALETALRCPEGELQRITLLDDDGVYNDNLNIRVDRWPHGAPARRVSLTRSISRHEIALSRDFIGLLLHEARRIDHAFQDHADKVPR